MADGEKETADFQIDINEHEKVIQGKIETKKEGGLVIIELIPIKPKWASKRALRVEISQENERFYWIQTSIMNWGGVINEN